MKEETIKMLKALKKSFKANIKTAKQNGDWLEQGQWENMLFGIQKIEEYEGIKFD